MERTNDVHPKGSRYESGKEDVNLLLIDDGEQRHYATIKNLSRLLASSNSKHKHKQHFCMNCLQDFQYEESRNEHFECCKDNKTVRIEMPKKGSLITFHNSQYQFKVQFIMYTDFEAILEPTEGPSLSPGELYT